MLLTAVIAYLLVTIAIGLLAARGVRGSADFLVAGRSLPTYMTLTTVFATWYGAEAVLSISVTAARDGLTGIPADPFGASTCLLLVALTLLLLLLLLLLPHRPPLVRVEVSLPLYPRPLPGRLRPTSRPY